VRVNTPGPGAGVAILGVVVAAAYLPLLPGGWMSDDFVRLYYFQHQRFATVFSSPDAFGYYRPVAQASLLANLRVVGSHAFTFRLTNLALHVCVLSAAYVVAAMLLHRTAALLATLAFALTPKAAQIAVLWVSARPELLLSLCSLVAVASWVLWNRGDGVWWLAAACAGYLGALLSKESAVLLPALLCVTPPTRVDRRRLTGAAMLGCCAAAALIARVQAGAHTPFIDSGYQVPVPISVQVGNAVNYFTRAMPSPLGLLLVACLAAGPAGWRQARLPLRATQARRYGAYALAWFLAFILPVLPMASRSELYLYFAGYGLCLFAGFMAHVMLTPFTRPAIIAVAVYLVCFGAYQLVLAAGTHRVLEFSEKLVDALEADQAVKQHRGLVVLVPGDPAAERLLHGSIGGYLDIAVKVALARPDLNGAVAYAGEPAPVGGLRFQCGYRGGAVILSRSDP
jgi:hypothetical protein